MRTFILILFFTFISSTNVYATNIEDDATEVTVPDFGDDLDDPFGGDDFDPFEEETTTQEESSSASELESGAVDDDVDAELLLFGYLSEPEESNVTLSRIYNLLLTFLYVYIINIGRQIIMRVFRKGHARHGFVD